MWGIGLFIKTSQRGCWNIVSYHNPHSLTWSWFISFALFRGDERRVRPLWFGYRTNAGLQWGFRIPFVGLIQWHRQRPIYFRDLYYRQRDEEDFAKPKPQPVRHVPIHQIGDGGKALH